MTSKTSPYALASTADDEDDDEEETVELRVSASRQDQSSGQRTALRKMSSSTSSRSTAYQGKPHSLISTAGIDPAKASPFSVDDGEDDGYRPPVRVGSTSPMLEVTKLAGAIQRLPAVISGASTGDVTPDAYDYDTGRHDDAKEQLSRLKLQAFWQLLLTGFEVLRFSIGKRAKKYVLWLGLDGNLFLGGAKNDKTSAKALFLADVARVQKGSDSHFFTRSPSWKDARGKGNLTFSIHGRHGKEERIFAIQVWKPTVRNLLVENFETLLRMLKSDADGEFPRVAQRVVAKHYARTGEILTLRQVDAILLKQEEERKSRDVVERDSDGENEDMNDSDSSDDERDGGERDILG
ncbi:hypothetical protein P43SY_009083 [Pythium insidiosum]|uniref:Uncharacterized protein n=1 Tax=Pythium insidiosum TaxID=114742 RepID=A0AAD5LS90_PYTIN|nr:hypothetical protein P43SY_009083 [Pythium insidiosum]